MSKKKHKHDAFDLSLEERLRRIYDDAPIHVPDQEDDINTDNEPQPAKYEKKLQNVLQKVHDPVRQVEETPAIPNVDAEMPMVATIPTEENIAANKRNTDVDALSIMVPHVLIDKTCEDAETPSLEIPQQVLDDLTDEDLDEDSTTADETEEDEEDYDSDFDGTCVTLKYDESTGTVAFSDGFNITTVNIYALASAPKEYHRKISGDKATVLALNVMDACITTTMPIKIMPEDEFVDLKSMTGNFTAQAYRFSDLSMLGSDSKLIAVYRLDENFFSVLAQILADTEKFSITGLFLKTLQDLCFQRYHMWDLTSAKYPDCASFLKESDDSYDFIWGVFFNTNGVDPISSAGKHMQIAELNKVFEDAMTSPGMYWDAEIRFENETPDDDEDIDDTDDESDESAEEAPQQDDEDELEKALKEGIEEDTQTPAETPKSESAVINASKSSSNGEYDADDFVFDVQHTK